MSSFDSCCNTDHQKQTLTPTNVQMRKSFLRFCFNGSYMLRWNDKLRPVDLVEIDKQGHKMILACLLWHKACEEKALTQDEQLALGHEIIIGGLCEYFYRLVVTDLKPTIFYRICANPLQYQQLTNYVEAKLAPILSPLGSFWPQFCAWHQKENDNETRRFARTLLSAAHQLASRWEFMLIKSLNSFDQDMSVIEQRFATELHALERSVPGLHLLLDDASQLARFANFCVRLRFQVRWTQTPRIPKTDVLGHMFMTAVLSYFFSVSINACSARCINNFYCALFHDLPELLTRDIISPVKQSSQELASLIKECEQEELERQIITPLQSANEHVFVQRLCYYLGLGVGSEFQESIVQDGTIRSVHGLEDLSTHYNHNHFDPKDGQLIKACDLLSAFLEADSSLHSGVSSPDLYDARTKLREKLTHDFPQGLQLTPLLADFD